MRCPFCDGDNIKVIDSRNLSNGRAIRRRRECSDCQKRFTTYERMEKTPIMVIKKDNRRERLDSEKILNGLLRATEKRNFSREELESIVLDIEKDISDRSLKGEIKTDEVGNIILERLKELDEVAYIRFASVYKDFQDVEGFLKEIEDIREKISSN
ncbi:MAG: transcriptional regulator NrdR [Fusobacteriota bacterium]